MVDWLADHIYHTTLGVIYLLKSKDAQTHRHSRWFLVPRTTVLGTATKVDNKYGMSFKTSRLKLFDYSASSANALLYASSTASLN